jgi:hypothetical protein
VSGQALESRQDVKAMYLVRAKTTPQFSIEKVMLVSFVYVEAPAIAGSEIMSTANRHQRIVSRRRYEST